MLSPSDQANEDSPRRLPAALGVDVGGTHLRVGEVDSHGQILGQSRMPTNAEEGPEAVLERIAMAVEAQDATGTQPVGVALAGQVEARTGRVRLAPNLGWRDVAAGERLRKRLGRSVVVTNDVRAATLAEWRQGAARGEADVVCVFVGTGVGGGIVCGGRLLAGATNAAGEVGHMTLVPNGRACHTCGNPGCLEAYAGGWAIAERAREAVRADAAAGEGLLVRAGAASGITARTVAEAARDGDPLALRLTEETVGHLAAGVVSLVNALNPGVVVMGGGVVFGSPRILNEVAETVERRALRAATTSLRWKIAQLGDAAGFIGAAVAAREATSSGGEL